ncbi:MAG TPA: MmcQ/YjbR family DNA-binding protein [Caulobacteraceae bacterium]|nr:MmcQ/YjbR family DNA-binding protein [Caulobacteraceae bacterium]
MVDPETLRRLALALPQAEDASAEKGFTFRVGGGKGFAWTYQERFDPRRPRRPKLDVLAVRCDLETKEMLIAAAPARFFDDDHYRGYPAVLVRLDAIDAAELGDLLRGAWRLSAPRRLMRGITPEGG